MTMEPGKNKDKSFTCHYFVDEAGDGIIFNRQGRVIVGNEGCSRYFMLGLLQVPDPVSLQTTLDTLRAELIADPYFRKIPSMQPQAEKTAFAFHAKDDLPEIRREVFKVLMTQNDFQFFAVVRDKMSVLSEIQRADIRYHPNNLYDKTVSRLFKARLHREEKYHITFAARGKSDRTNALRDALEVARQRAFESWNVQSNAPIEIEAVSSMSSAALQATDYFLWALQRFYERREDRYINFIWPICHLVHDVDDTRTKKYGVYYTQKNPLELGKVKSL